MTENPHELEAQLKSLCPAPASPGLLQKIEQRLASPAPGRMNWSAAVAAVAVAACVCLATLLIHEKIKSRRQYQAYQQTLAKKDQAIKDLQNSDESPDEIMAPNDRGAEKLLKIKVPPLPVQVPIVSRSDGAIASVGADDTITINLGKSDHLVPGLTFEVYDKHEGVPKFRDGMSDANLPVGKASIEVQQILPISSVCRVTKLEPGKTLAPGDLIANLVYDRNAKFNFFVYGKFDLSQTGHPNASDGITIAILIRQWGGRLQKDIDVDTDFVVMGSEPKIDDLPAEPDAFQVAQHDQQLADQKSYADQVAKASNLHIPIMNQNRFLYYIGFYDLATR